MQPCICANISTNSIDNSRYLHKRTTWCYNKYEPIKGGRCTLMKHARLHVIIASSAIAVLAIAVSFVVFYPSASAPSTATADQSLSALTAAATATNAISIQSSQVTPEIIKIHKGDTVIWTNNDATTHSIVLDIAHNTTRSGPLDESASYSVVFDHAGVFAYHLAVYPDTVGKIIVE